MEVWKIVFHSILEIFHSIPFWHLPYSIPKFPFHSIPCPAKKCKLGCVMSKLVCLKCIIDGGLRRLWGSGGEASAAEQFFVFFWEKLAVLMPLDHDLHVF